MRLSGGLCQALGGKGGQTTFDLLGCTLEDMMARLDSTRPLLFWTTPHDIGHIVPCSFAAKYGGEEAVILSFRPENLAWQCREHNRRALVHLPWIGCLAATEETWANARRIWALCSSSVIAEAVGRRGKPRRPSEDQRKAMMADGFGGVKERPVFQWGFEVFEDPRWETAGDEGLEW